MKMSRIQSTKQLKKKQTHLGFQIFVHWDWLLIWQPLSRFHKLHLRSCNKEITNDEEQKITPRRSGLETSATCKSMLLFIFLTFHFKLSLPLHCKWVCHISFMGFNTLLAMFWKKILEWIINKFIVIILAWWKHLVKFI